MTPQPMPPFVLAEFLPLFARYVVAHWFDVVAVVAVLVWLRVAHHRYQEAQRYAVGERLARLRRIVATDYGRQARRR